MEFFKLTTSDGFMYINPKDIQIIEVYNEKGVETETMKPAVNNHINLYFNNDVVITTETTEEKVYKENIKQIKKIIGGQND